MATQSSSAPHGERQDYHYVCGGQDFAEVKGKKCPHCEVGVLSDLCVEKRTGVYNHRCTSRHCHKYMRPHHLHPVFTEGTGSSSRGLQMQASLLLLKLLRVPHPAIHVLLNVNHKAIEDIQKRIFDLHKAFVERQEKNIVFGRRQNLERCGSSNLLTTSLHHVVWL